MIGRLRNLDEKRTYALTIRTTAVSTHGFLHIQVPLNPEYLSATAQGYELALLRMEDLWVDPLNRRIQLLLVTQNDSLLMEDWNKDEEIPLDDEEE